MSDHDHNHSNSNGLSPFLTGAIIGAALSYFLTTKSGQKVKDEFLKELSGVLEKLGEDIEEKNPIFKEEIEDKKEDVKQKLEEVSKDIKKEIDEVPQQVKKIQNKGRRFFFRKPSLDS